MKQKYFLLIGFSALIGIILISGCVQQKEKEEIKSLPSKSEPTNMELNSLNENQCKQQGYDWVHVPGLCAPNEQGQNDCGFNCDIKTSDGSKKCYSNNECEGACLCTKNDKDSEGFQVGECSQYKYFTEVIDCPCILETKTKTENFPYDCA